jgi:outer membrane lipoprotein-sorting protein
MTIGHKFARYALTGLALLFVLGLYSPMPSTAAMPADGNWSVEQLMQRLAQVKSARAKFVERKYLRVLTEPLELRGTLSYAAPGHLEKHTLTPKPESLVLDQDRLTIEDPIRKQRRVLALQDYPALWAFVESIRSTLAGDLQSLDRFYRVELEGDERDWRLLLKPRETKMQAMVNEIRITGSEQSVRNIEVLETGGDRSVMTITEQRQ